MSAPLSCSRKIRLERLKRFSNAQLDYLKRLYDGTPIDKKYLAGEIGEREILSCGLECVRRVRIEITENGILLFAKRREKPMPQISKVFVCPDYSFEAGIERVRGHAIIPK
jgi:hypothetical protein